MIPGLRVGWIPENEALDVDRRSLLRLERGGNAVPYELVVNLAPDRLHVPVHDVRAVGVAHVRGFIAVGAAFRNLGHHDIVNLYEGARSSDSARGTEEMLIRGARQMGLEASTPLRRAVEGILAGSQDERNRRQDRSALVEGIPRGKQLVGGKPSGHHA